MKQIITLVVLLSFMFTTTGCVSLEPSINQSRRYCNELFKDKGLDTSKEKSKWNKREYVKCVSNMTNANETMKVAEKTEGIWTVMLVNMAITFLIGFRSGFR